MADVDLVERPRRFIPALSPLYDSLAAYSYPLIRVAAGLMLVPHGWGKLFEGGIPGTAQGMASLGLEPAYVFAVYIGLLEFFGGLLLAVGFLTRLAAILVAGFMAVAAFYVHWPNGFFWTDHGFEYPLFWGLVALAIFFRGGGRLSVDRALGWEL